MVSFEELQKVYNDMRTVAPPDRGPFVTTFVWTVIAYCVYYIVAGLVVFALGKRLIQASFAAYKEARRDRS